MRDYKRIAKICNLLQSVWQELSDERLGQLLCNLVEERDIFYVEDDVLFRLLKDKQEELEQFDE